MNGILIVLKCPRIDLRASRFQNFLGEHAPDPPRRAGMLCHGRTGFYPGAMALYVDQNASAKCFDSLVGVLSLDDMLVWGLETLATPYNSLWHCHVSFTSSAMLHPQLSELLSIHGQVVRVHGHPNAPRGF